jgi:hypothetical protein
MEDAKAGILKLPSPFSIEPISDKIRSVANIDSHLSSLDRVKSSVSSKFG